ncbi:MAG TPA: stage V sporulation protein E [Pseudogracilibacillus sp.]|nr:stage V sporulation protein E [Pseudogracilibacillus sp.]
MQQKTSMKGKWPDFLLLSSIIALIIIGLVMVYSSSHVWAEYKYDDGFFYLKRQLLFAGAGLVAMYVLYKIPYYIWINHVYLIFFLCLTLLLLVLVPGIGLVRGGAQSWIGVGAFSIQPSEFMKLGLLLYLSWYAIKYKAHMTTFKKGFLYPLIIVIFVFALIMLQPDLGTGVVLVLTCMLLIFIAGARLIYFFYAGLLGLAGFVLLIISAPYRMKRITAYLNPWDDPLGDGFQIIQSLYAIGPGKLLGTGLGNSLQKYFYLPEPQTDFIFAIIGEELGFIGGLFVILLFFIFFWRGIKVALEAKDLYGRYLAFGIVLLITIQVLINISVVIGLIPVTGITLPFLSYGGSSLTLTLCSVGILLNISRYTTP